MKADRSVLSLRQFIRSPRRRAPSFSARPESLRRLGGARAYDRNDTIPQVRHELLRCGDFNPPCIGSSVRSGHWRPSCDQFVGAGEHARDQPEDKREPRQPENHVFPRCQIGIVLRSIDSSGRREHRCVNGITLGKDRSSSQHRRSDRAACHRTSSRLRREALPGEECFDFCPPCVRFGSADMGRRPGVVNKPVASADSRRLRDRSRHRASGQAIPARPNGLPCGAGP
jgi:hypothetical protein